MIATNVTFSANANDIFGTKMKNKTKKNENSLSAENGKAENDQIAHFWRRKRKRIAVGF